LSLAQPTLRRICFCSAGPFHIWRIEVVFAGNSNEGEQRIAPGIGKGGSHPLRRCRFADRANRTANPDKIIAAVKRGHQVLDSIH
jgi:hypothetical protein